MPHVVVVQFEEGLSLPGNAAKTGLQIFDQKAAAYRVHTIERIFPFLDHVDPTPRTRRNLLALRRTYYVRYSADVDAERVFTDLALAPGIVYAEPVPVNRTRGPVHRKRIDPNDPRFQEQSELGLMRLPEAWDVVKGSDGEVVIAVVDDGGEWRHEDLHANVWTNEDEIPGNGIDDDNNGFIDDVHGVNFHNGDDADNDPTPSPGNPHGTWVAGAASAVTDNNVGIAGAAWNAEIMHINSACPQEAFSICDGYQGILYAAMNGADIINASWSGLVRNDQEVRHLEQTLDLATDMGALVVASAGNENSSNDLFRKYPARSPRVLSVGATEKATRRRAGFSNYGRLVNVFAPGADILTTGPGNSYDSVGGTSFSSPLTAGLAALVKTRFPGMGPDALREHIRLTSESIDTENPGFAGQLGRGLVNARAAVQSPSLPAVRLQRWSWADDDGDRRIVSGDEVTITATVVNYLSDARALSVGLVGAEPYPFLDLMAAEEAVGFLAGGDSVEVQFEFRVAADAPDNQRVRLYTRIRDGAFEDGADQLSFIINLSLEVSHRSLSAFYVATGGDNWDRNDNWNITTVPSEEELATWIGVSANEGLVDGLEMGTNNLRGTLPSELGDLRSLRILDLFDNEGLAGPIPSELANLEQLEVLGLGGNSLAGEIPLELGNLRQLEVLWLPRNSLTGEIPPELGNLKQLEVLGLMDNSLTGPIPPELGNLKQLERLWLEENSLTGPIPPELGNLEQLEWLDLWNNSLTGPIPPELGDLERLERLGLWRNSLTGEIPPELGNLKQLEVLWLNNNLLTGEIPPELGNLRVLKRLGLWRNSLTGEIPPELGDLERLERLDLGGNSLTGEIPPELGDLEQLEVLGLWRNSLTGPIPPDLGNLKQLEWISLDNNSLTGEIPPKLGNLKQLEQLSLSANSFTGPIPPELGNLEQLEVLNLDDNSLTGPIPPELGNIKQLEWLNLQDNSLTGPIPPEFGNLERLEGLLLGGNSLTGPIPPELGNLKQLEVLWLNNNLLTGEIPPELGNLRVLKRLLLNHNSFTGQLPRSLMQLDSLEVFFFEGQSLCAPADDAFQVWLNRIPSHSGPTCTGEDGLVYVQYDQGEAVGTGVEDHLFVTLPADARMATRFVIDVSSGGKQWNRTIAGNDREARIEADSRVDQVTLIRTSSSDDQEPQIKELSGNRRGGAIGPEERRRLIGSMGRNDWERRLRDLLEGEQRRNRERKERIQISSGDESAEQRVLTDHREIRAPSHAKGERDRRFRWSSGEDHEGRFGASSADDREVRIDRIWLAPYYANQLSGTTLPTDAPRDFTIYIYSDREGVPADVLFSMEVADPRAYAEVMNLRLDFLRLDLSDEGIGALPDTIHIAYGNAGTDDNHLVSGPAPYTEKNVSHVYFQGVWRPLWDFVAPGGGSFNETVVPIRARFRLQTPLQFSQTVADQRFVLGQSVTPLVLPEAIGGMSPISYSLAPALPTGLAFDASTRTVSGTPTAITESPETLTYTATDAAGEIVSLQFSVEVYSTVSLQADEVPSTFALHGNYPNPFGGSTRIVFDLPSAAKVSVDVLDITGRRVRQVPARILEAGWDRSIEVSGAGLPSGMYLYRMHVDLPEGAAVTSGRFIHIR